MELTEPKATGNKLPGQSPTTAMVTVAHKLDELMPIEEKIEEIKGIERGKGVWDHRGSSGTVGVDGEARTRMGCSMTA